MKEKSWKTLAIIFIALFILETIFFVWLYQLGTNEIEKEKECYYNICAEYPDAYYELEVCSCYDYDFNGELYTTKTEYMNGK